MACHYRLCFGRDADRTTLICPAVYYELKSSCTLLGKTASGIQQRPTGSGVRARQAAGDTVFSHKTCRDIMAPVHALCSFTGLDPKIPMDVRKENRHTYAHTGTNACWSPVLLSLASLENQVKNKFEADLNFLSLSLDHCLLCLHGKIVFIGCFAHLKYISSKTNEEN